MNIGVILKETARSFYRNLWINIMLMVQFVLCFFLLLTILTFHIQIGSNDMFTEIRNLAEKKWYRVMLDPGYDFLELTSSPNGFAQIQGFYQEIENSEMFERFAFSNQKSVLFDADVMDERFNANKYDHLLDNDDGNMPASQLYFKTKDGDTPRRDVRLQAVQMDAYAFELFNLSVSEGEPLTNARITLASDDSRVPLWLGAAYKGYFKTGDKLRIQHPVRGSESKFFDCEVAGILESNSVVPMYEAHNPDTLLDDCVIFPVGMNIAYVPEDLDKRARYAGQYTDTLFHSYFALNEGVNYNDMIMQCSAWIKQYDVYPMVFYSTSFGTDILQNESQTTISILTVLTVVLLGFTLFCLLSSAISKLQANLRTYAIFISNGSGMGNIIIPYLLEMLIILIPAVALNCLALQRKTFYTQNYLPVLLIFIMAFGVFSLMGLYVVIKLKGVNTEELMRRKE